MASYYVLTKIPMKRLGALYSVENPFLIYPIVKEIPAFVVEKI